MSLLLELLKREKTKKNQNMKTLLIFTIVSALIIGSLNAQEVNLENPVIPDIKRNTIYFELGGNGIISSVNYERLFPFKGKMDLS